MHQAALDWIGQFIADGPAIDIGGRETNGHARWLFPSADWLVVDAAPGPGVDIVANGATWTPHEKVDFVLFAEVAEHTPEWRQIIFNIHDNMLNPGGLVVMTMAGPGRPVHGLHHDDPLCPGWYRNIEPEELSDALETTGFATWEVDVLGDDVRAWAEKRS